MDEFTKVTSHHRKAVIRLLHRGDKYRAKKRRGRSRCYSAELVAAPQVAREATDRVCSKRLQPFLTELSKVLRRNSESANGFYLNTLSTVDVATG